MIYFLYKGNPKDEAIGWSFDLKWGKGTLSGSSSSK